ncbi:hypothetical protein GCM10009678_33460 [Actinomadura kijaniata]
MVAESFAPAGAAPPTPPSAPSAADVVAFVSSSWSPENAAVLSAAVVSTVASAGVDAPVSGVTSSDPVGRSSPGLLSLLVTSPP